MSEHTCIIAAPSGSIALPCAACNRDWNELQARQLASFVDDVSTKAAEQERARIVQWLRQQLIPLVAELVRIPTAPIEHNEEELVRRSRVVDVAMKIKAVADSLIEREPDR